MKKWLVAGLLSLGAALPVVAEQNPPQPPTPPRGGEERHRDMRVYAMHFNGGPGDETARILPPGAWWKDQELAKRIELTPDQQKRIEDSFLQSKIELVHLHANLEEQELLLGPMLDGNPIDQATVLAQIGKIADTRAGLEKANAKMLLQIRSVLNQQQWAKLQQERPGMRHMILRTPDGPHSFNIVTPDLEKLRSQLQNLPALDPEKIAGEIREQLRNNPPQIEAPVLP